MVDDGIKWQSLGEAAVEGSRSCEVFVQRNYESEGYGDPGEHRFVVHGLYWRCTVLRMALRHFGRDSEDATRSEAIGCHQVNAKQSILMHANKMHCRGSSGAQQCKELSHVHVF